MNKFKLPVLIALSGLLGFGVITGASFSSSVKKETNKETEPITRHIQREGESTPATELSRDELNVTLTSHTVTDSSESFAVKFSSQRLMTYQSRYTNFYIYINDSKFDSEKKDSNYTAAGQEAQIDADTGLPMFNGVVYRIVGNASNKDVYIPSVLTSSGSFEVNVTGIMAECVQDWKNINSINIPSTITTVEDFAFTNVPADIAFNMGATEKPADWSDNWTDDRLGDNVTWGYFNEKNQYPSRYAKQNVYGSGKEFGTAENYIIGYEPTKGSKYDEEKYQLPLTATYDLIKADGTKETREYKFEKASTLNDYDGVGAFATSSATKYLDIDIEKGESVDENSIVFKNIYHAIRNSSDEPYAPDLTTPYTASAHISYSTDGINFSDYFTMEYKGVSSLFGYTDFRMSVSKVLPSIYPTLMYSVYEQYKASLEDGSVTMRYLFQTLYQAQYHFKYTYKGVEYDKVMNIETPIPAHVFQKDKNNNFSMLVKNSDVGEGFSASSVTFFEIIGLKIEIDYYKTQTIITKSILNKRFGKITVLDVDQKPNLFNVNLFLVLFYIAYTICFAGASAGLFAYQSNKYKNDEFKRVKPKLFIKTAALTFLGSLIVISAILNIVLRATLVASSVVVYNPLDAFIIVFGIATVIVIIYFVKYCIETYKSNKQRKMSLKLKLDNDVSDDGTK